MVKLVMMLFVLFTLFSLLPVYATASAQSIHSSPLTEEQITTIYTKIGGAHGQDIYRGKTFSYAAQQEAYFNKALKTSQSINEEELGLLPLCIYKIMTAYNNQPHLTHGLYNLYIDLDAISPEPGLPTHDQDVLKQVRCITRFVFQYPKQLVCNPQCSTLIDTLLHILQ